MQDNTTQQQESGKLTGLEHRQKWLERLMVAIILVLFIGFGAMFIAATAFIIDAFNNKQSSYQSLEQQVQAQNAEIQVLTNQLKNSTVTNTK